MTTQPQTVTIAQARASTASGLLVLDSGANIAAALPNPALTARVASFTLSGPAALTANQMTLLIPLGTKLHAAAGSLQLTGANTLNVAQLTAFEALPGFAVASSGTINLTATPAQFATLVFTHPAWFTSVSAFTIQLDGSSMGAYPASQLSSLITHGKTVTFVPSPGHTTLPIAAAAHDLATNTPALNALGGHQALTFTVLNEGTAISAADAASLLALQGFNVAAHTLAISDAGTNLSPRIGALLGHGFGQITVTAGTLSATATQLLDSTVHFAAGARAQLSTGVTVGATVAASLAGLPGFGTASGAVLSVADTAANLTANSSAWLSVAGAASLTADGIVSAGTAVLLSQIASTLGSTFSLAGHSLTVSDTLNALISLPSQAASLATSLLLNANATASAAQLAIFAALAHGGLAGHTIAVTDTAANLLALSSSALSLVNAATLSVDANLDATHMNTLASLRGFSAGGHSLTVSDTATNLLSLTQASLLQVTTTVLTADATLTAQQAQALTSDPGFSAGGHQFAIADTAANLLALPHTLQIASSILELSDNATVDAATLTQLSALGIKFTESGHNLTCQDTAANLGALAPSAFALATSEILGTSAVVSAATAARLAALPNFSLANGVTLTLQDSATNLIALGQSAAAAVTAETLPAGTTVTITAAQADALAALPHFSAAGSTIIVADTVAHLNAIIPTTLTSLGATVDIVDTAANLSAGAGLAVVQNAATVALSANAQVTATVAGQIASIPHFNDGAFQLNVSDTAANIAQYEPAIVRIAAPALVTDSGPVNIAIADRLAAISAAGLLSFQGGNQLLVQDSFAALTSSGNSSGLALADRIGVIDTPTNLVSASLHNWVGLNPFYTLSEDGTVSAALATSLAGLGSHFSAGNYVLGVADNAAATIAAASALTTLNIHASITDTASNLGSQASALLGLGNIISLIHVSDSTSVSASVAAALSGLAALLTGPALQVTGTAAQIDASLPDLLTLGSHVAITVSDSVGNISPYIADLATLGGNVTFAPTDTTPVTAGLAASLAPIASSLAAAAHLVVSDTSANIIAHASTLVAISAHLGTITLSDGPSIPVSAAAVFAALDSHLSAGVMLTVNGSVAAVTSSLPALATLGADHRLAGVSILGATAEDVVAQTAALNSLPAQISVSDSAVHITAALAGLAEVHGLQTIALTDGGTPALSMSVATLNANATILVRITSPYTISVSDTAAHIAADVALGSRSTIAAHLAQIGEISTNDGQALNLTQAQILQPGIDDSAASVLNKFVGGVNVIDVDVSHLTAVDALAHAPSAVSVTDTAAHLATDLALGSASILVSGLPILTDVTAVDGQPLNLTITQLTRPGVDDAAHSVVGLLQGAELEVTDAAISDLQQLAGLYRQPDSISITDTAMNISADLGSTNSALLSHLSSIGSIGVSDGLTISLTEQQVLAPGVDDGSGSILSRTSGGHLVVTDVAAADLNEMLDLTVTPTSISIRDTAAHIISNLATELADIGSLAAIDVTGTPLTLTSAEALSQNVDSGSGSLIDLVTGHNFDVSGASVAQLPRLFNLQNVPQSIAVSDSSANIVADLVSGNSTLSDAITSLGMITVAHGTLTLTGTQADTVLANAALNSVFGHLAPTTIVSVSNVPVSDLTNIATSGWPHVTIAVSDTVANIAADITSSSSSLLANTAIMATVSLTADGTVNAATLNAIASLTAFSTDGHALTVQDNAASILALAPSVLAFVQSVHVVDSAASIASSLDTLQTTYGGALAITLTDPLPAIAITAAQYETDRPTIDAVTNHGVFTVTGSAAALSGLAVLLASDPAVTSVTVGDSATDVIANLTNLQLAGPKLHILLSDTSITANLVAPLIGVANISPQGLPVVDTGTQIAAVVESGDASSVNYLNTYGAQLADSTPIGAADAAALERLTLFSKAGNSLVVWDTAQHLTSPSYTAALASGLIDSVHLKTTGGAVTVAASVAANLFSIVGFTIDNPSGVPNILNVSDTAAHIEGNLAILMSSRADIGAITVNSNSTINDQVLGDLQGLAVNAASGVNITVSDSGATIAANAVAQSGDHAILPSTWALSGDATVSEADAITLGGLSNFNAGPFTITLSLPSDTTISIADANKLAALGNSLNLGGHHLIASGTVTQLNALSSAALLIVTPALIDSVANIEALPHDSPLLQGTVEVTGNDVLSAASASSLLNLVHTASGPGISANTLTFNNTHAVTDTIANLRSLVASSAWTANATTRSAFHLVAQDSVMNLISPANTAFLSGLYATTIQGDVSIGASTAAALASASSSIHFTHAGFHITVQDSASNLLNTANAGGLGVADVVLLAAPDHVDAADAEALLAIPHFTLNTSLMIVDNSGDLLDGTLPAAIAASGFGSHIQVQLAGPETLDAQTAESLVSIPGFTGGHNLTIADDPSYLLDPTSLPAEQMAVQVTLAGDETVSANTVFRLSQIPHFTPGDSHLVLASNDFANAATLKAVADLGSNFDHHGHSLTMTTDSLALTPTEYAALQSDGIIQNGHSLGVVPAAVGLSDNGGVLDLTGQGVAGGTVRIYAADGSLILSDVHNSSGFSVAAPDPGFGLNFSLTEAVGGPSTEGAPVVILDTGLLESSVAAAGGSFASSGMIQVDTGKFVNIYSSNSIPVLTHAALVYDPSAHTVALDVPGQAPITLITLGGSTHPTSLDAAEILFKTHG